MKSNIFKTVTLILVASSLFTACKKDEKELPEPVEQEVITTAKFHVTGADGFDKTFVYKVENGFNNGTPGSINIDDIVLAPGKEYNATITLLNEKENPAEDITTEVQSENSEHLFIYESNPATGAGSITFKSGDKDAEGNPFNQVIVFSTGDAGNGTLTITLKHQPTNKNATTADAAGGETDVEAIFPVKLQ